MRVSTPSGTSPKVAILNALAGVLRPDLHRVGATDTHSALLQLARSHDGNLQLVTTNFDWVFECAAKRSNQTYRAYAAPALPIPKANRWNGLVHLHGLLPSTADEDENVLRNLVVTSGDFGSAYLTERWAARFVGELFRNYVVCFVGYGINDLVLRYMMDALAADRMLDGKMPQAYALGDCVLGEEKTQAIKWRSKGVLPILYEVDPDKSDHSALHQTLKAWADTYRDRIFGKERIVIQHAQAQPSESTQQESFVKRVIWAVSDQSGLPAKRFAELNPAPPLEWLMKFPENLVRHISVYSPASRVGNKHCTAWDDVMQHIACWLTRYLNDPRLIHWLVENGCQLHDQFLRLVESKLDDYERLRREGKEDEFKRIRMNSPHAIPDETMLIIWRLLLRGRVKPPESGQSFYGWLKHLKRDGLSASLRIQFRDFLSPMIALSKPPPSNDRAAESDSAKHFKKVFDSKLVLTADHVHFAIRDQTDEHWQSALPFLLDDLQQLLRDSLDLLREINMADDRKDDSIVYLPSIQPHWQNRGNIDWAVLIELLRDAWLAVRENDPEKAAWIAKCWFKLPYSTFKRLAFFAASQEDCINPALWSDWLLSDTCKWLWSNETRREIMRLLVLQGHHLTSSQELLEAAILDGPLCHMKTKSHEPDLWKTTEKYRVCKTG